MPQRPLPDEMPPPRVRETAYTRTLYFSLGDIQSQMVKQRPADLLLRYTRLMAAFLLVHPEPRRIGIIGLGGGSLVKFCHRYVPAAQLQVAEINPAVIALRDRFSIPADDRRLRIHHLDGAQAIRDPGWRSDVLLIDGFDADGLPEKLCTQSFYDDCRAALRPQGLLVANLHCTDGRLPEVIARLRQTFGDNLIFVDDDDHQNCIAFGSRGPRLREARIGPIRRLQGIDELAWRRLMPAFAKVAAALQSHQGCGRRPGVSTRA